MAIETVDLTMVSQAIPFEGLPTDLQQYSGIPLRGLIVGATESTQLVTAGNNLLVRASFRLPTAGTYIMTDFSATVYFQAAHFDTVTPLRAFPDPLVPSGGHFCACNSWGTYQTETNLQARTWMPERLPSFPVPGQAGNSFQWYAMSDTTVTVATAIPFYVFARFIEFDQLQSDGYQINTPVVTVG